MGGSQCQQKYPYQRHGGGHRDGSKRTERRNWCYAVISQGMRGDSTN